MNFEKKINKKEREKNGESFHFFEKMRNIRFSTKQKIMTLYFLAGLSFFQKEFSKIHSIKERDSIEIKIDENGNREYTHSDRETTHYLNYITGKKVSPQFVKKMYAHDFILKHQEEIQHGLTEKKIDSFAKIAYKEFVYRKKAQIENLSFFWRVLIR